MKIKIYYDSIKFRLKESKKIRKLIREVIGNEKKCFNDLIFIFTNDEEIIKINGEFLNLDYYTDVIAFNYSDEKCVKGEIYISIDTVKINADNYKISLMCEVLRVMIHGTLHLCGYKDNTRRSKKEMKKIEDKWIKEYKEI